MSIEREVWEQRSRDEVIELLCCYMEIIANQESTINMLKKHVKCLKQEVKLRTKEKEDVPSQMMTSPPTPLSVETCDYTTKATTITKTTTTREDGGGGGGGGEGEGAAAKRVRKFVVRKWKT